MSRPLRLQYPGTVYHLTASPRQSLRKYGACSWKMRTSGRTTPILTRMLPRSSTPSEERLAWSEMFPQDHWDTYIDILEKEGADLGKCYMSHLGLYPRK